MHISSPAEISRTPGERPGIVRPDRTYDILLVTESNDFDKYPAKQHAQRVSGQLGASDGLVYLEGQPTISWDDSDLSLPFRQRRYFYYVSGVEEPDCYITYDIRSDLLTLYIPNFDLHRAIWMGPTITLDEAKAKYDVDLVRYYAYLQSDIDHWTRRSDKTGPIFALHGSQIPRAVSKTAQFDVERLMPAMDAAREIKDEHEIRMIRRANEISGLAHRRILENIHRISNETEIEASFLDTCIAHGAKQQAYDIIAGSGENAAVLHYVKNDEPLRDRQLVCLDAGAEWDCYASDVTRTFPLKGDWPSTEARDIYQLVEKIQNECISGIRKGVKFLSLHLLAQDMVVKGLLELGILIDTAKDGDKLEPHKSEVCRIFFPHGLGHHMGLEVHDVSAKPITALRKGEHGDNTSLESGSTPPSSTTTDYPLCPTSESTLEEGMVVTVEPGIYFSRYALANAKTLSIAKYINFESAEKYIPVGGVRIEDDILVTAHGNENLTTAPKGEEMLDIIRNGCGRG